MYGIGVGEPTPRDVTLYVQVRTERQAVSVERALGPMRRVQARHVGSR
jgi:hypothetical protein